MEAPEHGYVITSNGEVLCGNMEHAPTDPFTMAMVGNLMAFLNQKLEDKEKDQKDTEVESKEKDKEEPEPEEETNPASGSNQTPGKEKTGKKKNAKKKKSKKHGKK